MDQFGNIIANAAQGYVTGNSLMTLVVFSIF